MNKPKGMNTNIYLIDSSSTTIDSPHYQRATIEDVVSYCSGKPRLGVDTETEGFDFTCKKMIMFQIFIVCQSSDVC